MKDLFELWVAVSVKCYSYRTANIGDVMFIIDRRSEDAKKFEATLAEKAGVSTDNHTLYAITNLRSNKTLYIACSDFKMYVGLSMEERHW